MTTAATALGVILASVEFPVRVRSVDSRRREAGPSAGEGSPQVPRSGAAGWIGCTLGALAAACMLPARTKASN
jgi:hypothetical protein